jgi:hypothetical protein
LRVRIVALLAVRNEERFVGNAIRHLAQQGVESYVIDNESTDRTREIVESLRGQGVGGVEVMPYRGVFEWGTILRRKEHLHCELGAHWYIHHDADMILQAPNPYRTLAEGIAAVDRAGDNAIDFDEFLFQPTGPDSDHDHDRYHEEMQHYVYYAPMPRFRVIAWKNLGHRVWLDGGGHWVSFHGRRIHPEPFVLRHYLALSAAHALRKYGGRRYLVRELRDEWHGKRATLRAETLAYPDPRHLRLMSADNTWDRSCPLREEPLFARAEPPSALLPRTVRVADAVRRQGERLMRRHPSIRFLLRRRRYPDNRVPLLPPRDSQPRLHNVLVLGSGRSGTSMVAALFRNSGYFMGFDMLGPSTANVHGYYEDTGITEINNLLLRWMLPWWMMQLLPGLVPAAHRDARALWLAAPRRVRSLGTPIAPLVRLLDAYARRQPFCYKDPRFSVTLPVWEQFVPCGTRRIVVFRDPDQTVDSILRDACETYDPPLRISPRWAYESWWRNYSRLLHLADAGGPAIFVHYDDVTSGAALPLLAAFTNAAIDTGEIDDSVSRSARVERQGSAAARCRQLYERLRARSLADLARCRDAEWREDGAAKRLPALPPAGADRAKQP